MFTVESYTQTYPGLTTTSLKTESPGILSTQDRLGDPGLMLAQRINIEEMEVRIHSLTTRMLSDIGLRQRERPLVELWKPITTRSTREYGSHMGTSTILSRYWLESPPPVKLTFLSGFLRTWGQLCLKRESPVPLGITSFAATGSSIWSITSDLVISYVTSEMMYT